MDTVEVLAAVFSAVLIVAAGAYVGAILLRSRQDPDVIRWGRRRLVAPRLHAFELLFFTLFFASRLISYLLFDWEDLGAGVMLVVSGLFIVAMAAAVFLRQRRLGRISRLSTLDHDAHPRR